MPASSSTAYLDVASVLGQGGGPLYDAPDLAVQILESRLGEINNPSEVSTAAGWIRRFVLDGFKTESFDQRFLFSDNNAGLRKGLLGLTQRGPYALDADFVKDVYGEYKQSPDALQFDALHENAWLEFAQGLHQKDAGVGEALLELLKSPAVVANTRRYCEVLYHGYRANPRLESRLDAEIRSQLLQTPDVKTIDSLQDIMAQPYWEAYDSKNSWIVNTCAFKLFNLGPAEWAKMPRDKLVRLAVGLAKASGTADYRHIALKEWVSGIGKTIKQNPAPEATSDLCDLLAYCAANLPLDARTCYAELHELFANDQALFTVLHAHPPDPSAMQILHGKESKNLSDSVEVLTRLLALNNRDGWTLALWDCLRDSYYLPHRKLREQLFEQIIQPIAADHGLAANPLRQRLMLQTYAPTTAFLTDAHSYEIAHHLLTRGKMTDPVLMEGEASGSIDALAFAIEVFGAMSYEENNLWGAASLRSVLSPQTRTERLAAYANAILAQPLVLMCWAFMGNADKTKGVVFELDDVQRGQQFERLLRLLGEIRVELRKEGIQAKRIDILDSVAAEIVKKLEAAVISNRPDEIIRLIRLVLKITAVLDEDKYLDRALEALRKNVFGLGEDASLRVQLSPGDLNAKADCFRRLHSEDLIKALRAVGKMQYVEKFYRQLYVPLRSIDGFFRLVGASPYVLFVGELRGEHYDRQADLQKAFQDDVNRLGAIHDAEGKPCYINAEKPVADLLEAYFRALSTNVWRQPELPELNRNVNLEVLRDLLIRAAEEWRLADLDDAQRSERYEVVTRKFLDNLGNPERMDRTVEPGAAPATCPRWDFWPLLHSLLDLHEIHGFPLPGVRPADVYEGSLTEEAGIRRKPLVAEVAVRKVKGELRSRLLEVFGETGKDGANLQITERLADLALLLPNMSANNEADASRLEAYRAQKKTVFDRLAASLAEAASPAERVRSLLWMCRLDASIYALGGDEGLGYKRFREQHLTSDLLETAEGKALLLEEYRLIRVNQGDTEAKGCSRVEPIVTDLVKALCESYPILREHPDHVGQALVELIRQRAPTRVLQELRPEDVATLAYLTSECKQTLGEAAQRASQGAALSKEEGKSAARLASSLVFLHSFFLPYVHEDFDAAALYASQTGLAIFSMGDRGLKESIVRLLAVIDAAGGAKPEPGGDESLFALEPQQIKTFILAHNFMPLALLEAGLDDFAKFRKLTEGSELSIMTYNFRLLWQCENRTRITIDSLCDEVLSGIDQNRRILADPSTWKDADYLSYFFGDMQRVLGRTSGKGKMPLNFDRLIRRLAVLPADPRLAVLTQSLRQLKDEAEKLAPGVERDRRVKQALSALAGAETFDGRVRQLLGQGFDYFGGVVAGQFQSPFGMQRALEMAGDAVRDSGLTGPAGELYEHFYASAAFGPAGDGLRPELEKSFVKRFYTHAEPGVASRPAFDAYRDRFQRLIDGNEGLAPPLERETTEGFMKSFTASGRETKLDKLYKQAAVRLLRCLFCGQYLEPGQAFLGDMIWERRSPEAAQLKPLDFDARAGDIQSLLLWIADCTERYGSVPQLQAVFGGAMEMPATSSQPFSSSGPHAGGG